MCQLKAWTFILSSHQVMKVLLRQHGLNLSGVKSDLYTMIGMVCVLCMHPLITVMERLG